MSCDNVPRNGEISRQAVTGVAQLADMDLAQWIEDHVTFTNCMLDRITPATSDAERNFVCVEQNYGFKDQFRSFVSHSVSGSWKTNSAMAVPHLRWAQPLCPMCHPTRR